MPPKTWRGRIVKVVKLAMEDLRKSRRVKECFLFIGKSGVKWMTWVWVKGNLGEEFGDGASFFDAREPHIETLGGKGEAGIIDAHTVKDGGVEFVQVDR